MKNQTLQDAQAGFYAALNEMFTGNVDPMLAVWSHANDVTYMGPGGEKQVGWQELEPIWREHAAMKLGGNVEPRGESMFESEDIGIYQNEEYGENTNAKGKVESVSIRATNVFRKENGEWKMISHHTDLLPYLAES